VRPKACSHGNAFILPDDSNNKIALDWGRYGSMAFSTSLLNQTDVVCMLGTGFGTGWTVEKTVDV